MIINAVYCLSDALASQVDIDLGGSDLSEAISPNSISKTIKAFG
jgi:hypothetical protein